MPFCEDKECARSLAFLARQSVDNLMERASRGCPSCFFINQVIAAFCSKSSLAINQVRDFKIASEGIEIRYHQEEIELAIFKENCEQKSCHQTIALQHRIVYIDVDATSCPVPVHTGRRLPGRTSSDATFRTIASWLSECTGSHKRCGTDLRLPRLVPRRLLDLGNNQVILREPIQPSSYACLSHCWGSSKHPLRTTSQTLQSFQSEVPWKDIPQTFKDAISVCRRLGIQYLWIDSLCIIQDSAEDWEQQAAVMADIYENAFITIAATRSPNSSRGCFADTDSRFIAAPVSGYSGVYVRVLTPRWPPIWAMHDSKMPEWPLLTRGWVYQELRLSTRILHFGPEEVTWECASQRRCESGLNDEDWAVDDAYYDTQGYASWPYWRLEREPLLLWHRTVHEYSGLRLSFETDKLVALSALTKRMEELRVNDRYILGLWEKTLLLDLLWYYEYLPSPERNAVFPSMNSNFPSWTWASRENPVGWESHLTTTLASVCVKEINYTPCGPRHMGFPSGAEIVLQAPLVESRQLIRNGRSTLERLSRCQPDRSPDLLGRASRLSSVPDHPDANVLLEELDVENFWNDEKVCYQHLYDGVLDEGTGATAEESLQRYFLPIGISPPGTGDRVWAIQVQRKPGTDKFQRVGFGAVSHVMAYEADLRDEAGRLRIDSDIRVKVLRTLRGRVTAILDRMPTQTITLV